MNSKAEMLCNQIDQTMAFLCYCSGFARPSFSFFIPIYLFRNKHKDSLLTKGMCS